MVRRKFLLLVFIVVALGTLSFLVYKYQSEWRYLNLVSSIEAGDGVQVVYSVPASEFEGAIDEEEETENLVTEAPLYLEEDLGILAVSTGEISQIQLNSAATGELIANASSVKVVTKNSQGRLRVLRFVLQIYPLEDPSTNISPWFVEHAAQISSVTLPAESTSVLTGEQLISLFPKGSKWVFMPWLSSITPPGGLPTEISSTIQQYNFLAARYYGGDPAELEEALQNDLLEHYREPILLTGIDEYLSNALGDN